MRVVIIGAGEVGFFIAKRLAEEKKEVVVIDQDQSVLDQVGDVLDVETVCGSGSSPDVLQAAGIAEAGILLAVTDSDEINLIACALSSLLTDSLLKVARLRNPGYLAYKQALAIDRMGIDFVINPEEEVIKAIEGLIQVPGAVEVVDFPDLHLKLVGIKVTGESPIMDVLLSDIKKLLQFDQFIIAAIDRFGTLIVPSGKDQIAKGDVLYFLCADKHFFPLAQKLGAVGQRQQREIFIVGGGRIGFNLAKRLEANKHFHVKLLEKDAQRCQYLAENLDQAMVLHGDGTDQNLLLEENIASMDVLVTLTGDEENNILCSLLAKRLGAGMTITRINKSAYLPLMQTIGLTQIVSPRISAANSILRFVRKGSVISSSSIRDEAEAMEIRAEKGSRLTTGCLKELGLPNGVIVLSIVKGKKVTIPTGESKIDPGDKVMLFCTRKNVSRVEKWIVGR